MKLMKLSMHDYKMFKDFHIDFVDEDYQALPIVVLAGINGSGKTTVLKSIFDSNRLKLDTIGLMSRPNNESAKVRLMVQRNKNTIVNFDESIDGEINNSPTDIITSEEEKKYYLEHIFSVYLEDGCKNYSNPSFRSFFGSLDGLEDIIRQYIDSLIYEHDIKASRVYNKVGKFIEEVLEDISLNITFDSIDKNKKIIFINSSGEKFPLNELSSGEKTIFSQIIYLYFSDIKDSVFLIDEPELSLHPSWQNKILKIYENFARKNNCQIIIATHSPHIIGSAKPKYIRVLKNNNEKIEVIKYTQSYGLEFSQILTDIMGVEYLRTPEVAKKIDYVKKMIILNEYNSDKFKELWNWLEKNLGSENLDLKLLKLEIISREKNAPTS